MCRHPSRSCQTNGRSGCPVCFRSSTVTATEEDGRERDELHEEIAGQPSIRTRTPAPPPPVPASPLTHRVGDVGEAVPDPESESEPHIPESFSFDQDDEEQGHGHGLLALLGLGLEDESGVDCTWSGTTTFG